MKCDECTLCCKLLQISDVDSPLCKWCQHCVKGKGCSIYNVRPEPCRKFECSWLQMKVVKKELRPDKCKVIFQRINDSVFIALRHPDYEVKKIVKQQIASFVKEGFSVVLAKADWGERPMIYLAKGHTSANVWQTVKDRAKELMYDSTKLH